MFQYLCVSFHTSVGFKQDTGGGVNINNTHKRSERRSCRWQVSCRTVFFPFPFLYPLSLCITCSLPVYFLVSLSSELNAQLLPFWHCKQRLQTEDMTLFDSTWCIQSLSNATFFSISIELCSLVHDTVKRCFVLFKLVCCLGFQEAIYLLAHALSRVCIYWRWFEWTVDVCLFIRLL